MNVPLLHNFNIDTHVWATPQRPSCYGNTKTHGGRQYRAYVAPGLDRPQAARDPFAEFRSATQRARHGVERATLGFSAA